MSKKTNEKGFTIIEVVLVLAIAGLIFLIVFLALPQLQRSRRDTQRRNDVGRILASLESYAGNHNGEYPSESEFGDDVNDSGSFLEEYFGTDNFADPSEGDYTEVDDPDDPGEMNYEEDEDCDGNSGDRYVSVTMKLEQDSYCQDNR
jgi:prepilin-type N-terminal cleavage/methylation domain-containing protein